MPEIPCGSVVRNFNVRPYCEPSHSKGSQRKMFLTFHADLFTIRRARPLRSAVAPKRLPSRNPAGLFPPPLLMPRPTTGASLWGESAAHGLEPQPLKPGGHGQDHGKPGSLKKSQELQCNFSREGLSEKSPKNMDIFLRGWWFPEKVRKNLILF